METSLLQKFNDLSPPDGFTPEELGLIGCGVMSIYAKLPNDRLRFIACTLFELGYRQEDVAIALGISQEAVSQQTKTIAKVLAPAYKNRRRQSK